MKLAKYCILSAALIGLSLVACNHNNEPVEDNTIPVFVLSGQSNMEGSTYWKHPTSNANLLEDYFEERELDFAPVRDGIPNVLTTFYGFLSSKWLDASSYCFSR